jgi:uncharacterized cupredoxin-like copper-binding protein
MEARMMHRRTTLLSAITLPAIVLAGAVLAFTAFSGDDGAATAADTLRLTVTVGDSLTFDSPSLTVQAGRRVLVTVRNVGATDHDFVIASMPARDVVVKNEVGHSHGDGTTIVGHPKQKGEVTIQFTPAEPGAYEFYCSVTGHKEAGMTGAITVM